MNSGGDGCEDAINGSILSVNSPRIGKRNRGGSFSGLFTFNKCQYFKWC